MALDTTNTIILAAIAVLVLALLFPPARAVLLVLLRAVRIVVRTLLALPFVFQFIGVYILAVLALLFNAKTLYGDEYLARVFFIQIYVGALALTFSLGAVRNPLFMSLGEFAGTFLIVSIFGAAFFTSIRPFDPTPALLTTSSVALLFTNAFVVAIGEELLFRVAIPSFFPGPPWAGQVLSGIAFGFMHWTAYHGNLSAALVASALGIIFGLITVFVPRNGFVIACALHFTWNAAASGYVY